MLHTVGNGPGPRFDGLIIFIVTDGVMFGVTFTALVITRSDGRAKQPVASLKLMTWYTPSVVGIKVNTLPKIKVAENCVLSVLFLMVKVNGGVPLKLNDIAGLGWPGQYCPPPVAPITLGDGFTVITALPERSDGAAVQLASDKVAIV